MIKINGKEYESKPFTENQMNAILNLNAMTIPTIIKTLKDGLENELRGSMTDFVHGLHGKMPLTDAMKLMIGMICQNELQVLILLADLCEKFPTGVIRVSEVGYRLYSQGFYTDAGSIARVIDILENAEYSKVKPFIIELIQVVLEEE